jgi:hypothetical protein
MAIEGVCVDLALIESGSGYGYSSGIWIRAFSGGGEVEVERK